MPKIVFHRGWIQQGLQLASQTRVARLAAGQLLAAIEGRCGCCAESAIGNLNVADQIAAAEYVILHDDELDKFFSITPEGVKTTGLPVRECKGCTNMTVKKKPDTKKEINQADHRKWTLVEKYEHLVRSMRNIDDVVSMAEPISNLFLAALPLPDEEPITVVEYAAMTGLDAKEVSSNIRRAPMEWRVEKITEAGKRACLYRLTEEGYEELMTLTPWLVDISPATLGKLRLKLAEVMPTVGFKNVGLMAAAALGADNVRDMCAMLNRDFHQTKMSVILRKYPFLDKFESAAVSKENGEVAHKYVLNDLSRKVLSIIAGVE